MASDGTPAPKATRRGSDAEPPPPALALYSVGPPPLECEGLGWLTWSDAVWDSWARLYEFRRFLCFPPSGLDEGSPFLNRMIAAMRLCLREGGSFVFLLQHAPNQELRELRGYEGHVLSDEARYPFKEHADADWERGGPIEIDSGHLLVRRILGLDPEWAGPALDNRPRWIGAQIPKIMEHVNRNPVRVVLRADKSDPRDSASHYMEKLLTLGGYDGLDPSVAWGIEGNGTWIVLPWSRFEPEPDDIELLLAVLVEVKTLTTKAKHALRPMVSTKTDVAPPDGAPDVVAEWEIWFDAVTEEFKIANVKGGAPKVVQYTAGKRVMAVNLGNKVGTLLQSLLRGRWHAVNGVTVSRLRKALKCATGIEGEEVITGGFADPAALRLSPKIRARTGA